MTFLVGEDVYHSRYGVGVVVRVSPCNVGNIYSVQFGRRFISMSESMALSSLIVASGRPIVSCPKCDFNQVTAVSEPAFGIVAYECVRCGIAWSAFTNKIIKRLTLHWRPAFSAHPRPVSELGPVHVFNVRRHRRIVRPESRVDLLDEVLTKEIWRRWYLYPLVRVVAPIFRWRHDRRLIESRK